MGQELARRKFWRAEVAHKKQASDAQNLIRPDKCDRLSHSAMVAASENELCSGEGVQPDDHEIGEDMIKPTVGVRPIAPTKAQLKEHLPLHLNYRSWCADCVSGKGHSKHHRSSTDEHVDEQVGWTTLHMDYCFYNKKTLDEHEPDEVQAEGSMTVLVTYDEVKEAFWTLPVAEKGANEEAVQWCCGVLEDSGYAGCEITIKSDQEPAIVSLRRAIGATRTGATVPLNSPVRCSKSNGRIENAVKRFQGQLRVLKHFFEGQIKR